MPRPLTTLVALVWLPPMCAAEEAATDTTSLVAALKSAAAGNVVKVARGTYELTEPLAIPSGVTLTGSGIDETIITPAASWEPSTATLPDPEVKFQGLDSSAYLIRVDDKAGDVTISNMTLRGPRVHGGIFGFKSTGLHVHHVRVEDVLWSGIRTLAMQGAKIHDCEFIDAGGRWKRGGEPGVDGGITGGGLFVTWMADSEIAHNRFIRTREGKENSFFGIKGRQGKRCRIHYNTIEVNFSIEFPFENDEDMEIDHNICRGTISIPKHAGGPVPESGRTFHIHHNWMRPSYAIEFARNGVEIDHNLFDFDIEQDGGNLISGFGRAPAKGPARFHHNLISNPGRGVIWINEVYNNLTIDHNEIVTRTTATPRKEGLFGFNRECDFSTITIRDNVITCEGQPRPLLRCDESYSANVRNNVLTNVADVDRYENPPTGDATGLEEPLVFECGVHGEVTVANWEAGPTARR